MRKIKAKLETKLEGPTRGPARCQARGQARSQARGPARGQARGQGRSQARGPARGLARVPSGGLARGQARSHTRSPARGPASSQEKGQAGSQARSPARRPRGRLPSCHSRQVATLSVYLKIDHQHLATIKCDGQDWPGHFACCIDYHWPIFVGGGAPDVIKSQQFSNPDCVWNFAPLHRFGHNRLKLRDKCFQQFEGCLPFQFVLNEGLSKLGASYQNINWYQMWDNLCLQREKKQNSSIATTRPKERFRELFFKKSHTKNQIPERKSRKMFFFLENREIFSKFVQISRKS